MSETLFAGLDVSTQGTKLVIVDPAGSDVVFVGAVNYDTDLPRYGTKNGVIQNQAEGASESDPAMWIEAVHRVFQQAKDAGVPMGAVRCISVSGQQHGLVSLDAAGNLTRATSKLWNDFSTAEECAVLTRRVGGLKAMIRETGNSQRTGYTAAKIFHMRRHEPQAFRRTATFFLVHNYVNWVLTGGRDGGVRVMEPGDASGMALWNPKTGRWSKKTLDAIDPTLAKRLPAIRPSDASIGRIGAEFVTAYGFPADCRVDAGSGDNMYGAVGTGNVRPGTVTVSLGTSGTAYTFMTKPYVDPTGEIAAFCDSTGHYLPLLCVSNLANGYNEILRLHGLSHDGFNALVRNTQPGNRGRILLPWYVGERTPDLPAAAPVYFGFGLDDFGPQVLSRAVLEGHVLNLYEGFCRMPVKPKEIRLTGGMSKSEAWCRTIADVFEAETVPVEGEGAALGAALHAAWVWTKESGKAGRSVKLEDVVRPFIRLDETHRMKPDPANVAVYRDMKKAYFALSGRVRGIGGDDPFVLRSRTIG
jgi:xylulokinase